MKLLDAAFLVFAAQGYPGATVDAIAETAGVSKGAVYFHFPSKEDVFVAVLWERVREEERRLRDVLDGQMLRSPERLLYRLAAFLDFGDQSTAWPALLVEFWSQAARSERVRAAVTAVTQFRRRALFAALGMAADANLIHPAIRLDHCADVLLTFGDGLVAQRGAGQLGSSPESLASVLGSILGIDVRQLPGPPGRP